MTAHNGEGDSMRGASIGLGGSFVLLAAAVAVIVLALFEPLARYGVAAVLQALVGADPAGLLCRYCGFASGTTEGNCFGRRCSTESLWWPWWWRLRP